MSFELSEHDDVQPGIVPTVAVEAIYHCNFAIVIAFDFDAPALGEQV